MYQKDHELCTNNDRSMPLKSQIVSMLAIELLYSG